jgi:hypothetical protein
VPHMLRRAAVIVWSPAAAAACTALPPLGPTSSALAPSSNSYSQQQHEVHTPCSTSRSLGGGSDQKQDWAKCRSVAGWVGVVACLPTSFAAATPCGPAPMARCSGGGTRGWTDTNTPPSRPTVSSLRLLRSQGDSRRVLCQIGGGPHTSLPRRLMMTMRSVHYHAAALSPAGSSVPWGTFGAARAGWRRRRIAPAACRPGPAAPPRAPHRNRRPTRLRKGGRHSKGLASECLGGWVDPLII